MGCAASSDTGTEYVSLGHHGTTNVSKKSKPIDTQLHGNSRFKRRNSSSSSSSSSSSDSIKRKSNGNKNHVNVPLPPINGTENDQKLDEKRNKLPPIDRTDEQRNKIPTPAVYVPVKEERKEERQQTPPPPLPPSQLNDDRQQLEGRQEREPISPPPFGTIQSTEEQKQWHSGTTKVISETTNEKQPQEERQGTPKTDEERKPTPQPTEERQPTPQPTQERQSTPQPTQERQPTPQPTQERQPTPQPTQEPQPTPQPDPPSIENKKTSEPFHSPPEDRQMSPKPEEYTGFRHLSANEMESNGVTPSAPVAPGGHTDFNDKTDIDLPDFGRSEYTRTDIGTYEKCYDFRTVGSKFSNPSRPTPNDNGLYTDFDFTVEKAVPSRRDLGWQRPPEIAPNPTLFCEGTTRFDIGQGQVGTCWFLSMVANIADKPELLKRVIPNDYKVGKPGYDGVFHCRFWRFGHWSDVYIDDFLPTTGHGNLFGAHSNTDPNEMWVALLEKAFARLYGSYDEVTGGRTADAFMNLTAGVGEVIKFEKMKMTSRELFYRLKNAFQSPTTMVGCVCPDRSNDQYGLVGGHAYSLNGTQQVDNTMLVRVRNPWGRKEWTGPWSDGSPEMQQNGGSVPHPNKDDGEFYMDIEHFLQFFEQCTICNITPDVDRDGNPDTLNYITTLFGNWRRGKAGGFQKKTKNPLFCVTIPDTGADRNGDVPVVVQLVQKISDRQDDKIGIRVDLYKVLYEDSNMIVLDELGDKNNLYLIDFSCCYRFCVQPGKYVAIPSTMHSDEEDSKVLKEFLVRFFTTGPVENPFEVDEGTKILSGKGPELDIDGTTLKLGYTQCFPGRFITGQNAGGQISCQTFGNNPQLLLRVSETQHVKVEIMQPVKQDGFPLGIKLFQNEDFTDDYQWFARNYNEAIKDLSGNDGPFSYGDSVDCGYRLDPGTYLLIIHANSESDENDFALAIYSEKQLQIRSTHMT